MKMKNFIYLLQCVVIVWRLRPHGWCVFGLQL